MNFRRYIIVLSLLGLAALTVVAGVNLITDPFGAYGNIHYQPLADYSDSLGTRTARAEKLRRGDWEMLIIGSSRPQMGYAPDHPALRNFKAFNAALPGTNMRELLPVTQYTLKHNQPSRILLGIDFVLFSEGRDYNDDFAQSRFSSNRDLVSYHLDNTISLRACYASAKSIFFCARHAPRQFTPYGQTTRHTKDVTRGHRRLFADRLNGFFTNPETYANYQYSNDRLECFRRIIQVCKEHGVALDIVINPVHAAQLEAVRLSGLWPTFEQWIREVTAIVEVERSAAEGQFDVRLVSFLSVSPYCDEAIPAEGDTRTVMQFWWESSHFKGQLGDYVLDELYGSPPPDRVRFGTTLTPDTADAHLATLRSDHDRWEQDHPEDCGFVRSVARKAGLIP